MNSPMHLRIPWELSSMGEEERRESDRTATSMIERMYIRTIQVFDLLEKGKERILGVVSRLSQERFHRCSIITDDD